MIVALIKTALLAFRNKFLDHVSNIFLFAMGITVALMTLFFYKAIEKNIFDSQPKIDLVIGAKGSPLQLVLASVFHIENPTGNISKKTADSIANHPFVKRGVPISIGDSYKGIRIVGSDTNFTNLYQLNLINKSNFPQSFEAWVSNDLAEKLNFKLGSTFVSSHGLTEDAHQHDNNFYTITGIFTSNSEIANKLIITNLSSVWEVHGNIEKEVETEHEHEHEHEHHQEHSSSEVLEDLGLESSKELEITAMLVQYASPMAMFTLPKSINNNTFLQAASPVIELNRLFGFISSGAEALKYFSYFIFLLALITTFISIYNSVRQRKFEIAMMRIMGAGRWHVMFFVLIEGLLISLCGIVLGFLGSHFSFLYINTRLLNQTNDLEIFFYPEEIFILISALVLGLLASIIPGIVSYRADVLKQIK